SEPELDLLTELAACCDEVTVTFCMDDVPSEKASWLSPWSTVRRAFQQCEKRFLAKSSVDLTSVRLPRDSHPTRFVDNRILQHLERHWAEPVPFDNASAVTVEEHLHLAVCADPEAEATFAAREILRFVRGGGRFREVSVLVRGLEAYHRVLGRSFA